MNRVAGRWPLIALVVVPALVSCTTAGPAGGPASTPPAPATSTPPEPPLPTVNAYRIGAGEPAPDVKRAAAGVLDTLLNYPAGGGTPQAAQARLADAGLAAGLADQAGPLLDPGVAQAAEVVYPQLGGLTATTASVMAVVRLHQRRDGQLTQSARTVDLRLTKGATGWAVSSVAFNGATTSAGPAAARSALATAVLADDRITMSDTARDEVGAGAVDERVLRLLAGAAEQWPVSVSVFRAGHPYHVFGTDRVSNHSRGRAVDIWAVGGVPVAQQQRDDGSPARALMRYVLAAGAGEVGGPWQLRVGERSSFTNVVHQDHVHVGIDQ